jgi:hypothetical protein
MPSTPKAKSGVKSSAPAKRIIGPSSPSSDAPLGPLLKTPQSPASATLTELVNMKKQKKMEMEKRGDHGMKASGEGVGGGDGMKHHTLEASLVDDSAGIPPLQHEASNRDVHTDVLEDSDVKVLDVSPSTASDEEESRTIIMGRGKSHSSVTAATIPDNNVSRRRSMTSDASLLKVVNEEGKVYDGVRGKVTVKDSRR